MKVVLLRREQIDSNHWDDFITHSPQSILYAFSWYLDTVAPQWAALVWLNDNDEWEAVMPLPLRRKFGFEVIQQPFFCQLLGVFTTTNYYGSSSCFFDYLARHFKYISIYTGRFSNDTILPSSFQKTICHTHLLHLDKPHYLLQKQYTLDRLKNLKRGLNQNWEIVESTDIDPIIDLFKENHAQQIDGGVAEKAYNLLREVTTILQKKQAFKLWYALKNGKIEAGVMFAIYAGRFIYLFNAASETGRRGNARTVLIDRLLAEYAESGYIFDFESPQQKTIADFYKSFGAIEEPYLEVKLNNLPFPLKQLQQLRLSKK